MNKSLLNTSLSFSTDPIITLTVLGNLPRKSNNRIFTGNRMIRSKKALDFQEIFLSQISEKYKLKIKIPCALVADIYYKNILSDLSDEELCDLLEIAEIIEDDVLIVEKHTLRLLDRQKPRILFSLYLLEDYPLTWLPKRKTTSLQKRVKAKQAQTQNRQRLTNSQYQKLTMKNISKRYLEAGSKKN